MCIVCIIAKEITQLFLSYIYLLLSLFFAYFKMPFIPIFFCNEFDISLWSFVVLPTSKAWNKSNQITPMHPSIHLLPLNKSDEEQFRTPWWEIKPKITWRRTDWRHRNRSRLWIVNPKWWYESNDFSNKLTPLQKYWISTHQRRLTKTSKA